MKKNINYFIICLALICFLLISCEPQDSVKVENQSQNNSEDTENEKIEKRSDEDVNLKKVYTVLPQNNASYVTNECILIEKADGSRMNETDKENVETMTSVSRVELYGTANRISYYCKPGEDYEICGMGAMELRETEKTMRSAGNLTQEALAEGVLPEKSDEIAVYTSDISLLGEQLTIYCYDRKYMGQTENQTKFAFTFWNDYSMSKFSYGAYCIERNFTITGILKEPTTQIYFSEDFCDMISRAYGGMLYADTKMQLLKGEKGVGLAEHPGKLSLTGDLRIGTNTVFISNAYSKLPWNENADNLYFEEMNKDKPCLVLYQKDCGENEVRMSERLANNNRVGNECQKIYKALLLEYELPEGTVVDDTKIIMYDKESWMKDSAAMPGISHLEKGKRNYCNTLIKVSDNIHQSGAYVLETGREIFDRIYGIGESYEMAVFPAEGTDMESLKEELLHMGYQAAEEKSIFEIWDHNFDHWSMSLNDEMGNPFLVTRDNYEEFMREK